MSTKVTVPKIGGRTKKARKPNAWAKAAGEYYNANKAKFDSFSDVLQSEEFKAYYHKKGKKGKKMGGEGDNLSNLIPNDINTVTGTLAANAAAKTDDSDTAEKDAAEKAADVEEPTVQDPTVQEPPVQGGKKKKAKKSKKRSTKKSRKSKKRFFGLM